MELAKWIWKSNESRANTWMCFVRDIHCTSHPECATANIAADSKYWLYINGKLVVFEGGLKRGQMPDATCFDEVDLSGHFVKGKNRIAVLVWHLGKNGFAHVSSGQGGFFFDADIDDMHLLSDEAWKVKKHPAYIAAPDDDIGPNFRLAESDIYYDAALDIGLWQNVEFNVDDWDAAYVLNSNEANALGKLIPRGIPMFRDFGIHEFLNSPDIKGMLVEEDTVLEMKPPYNLQCTPILKLEAPVGKKITIKGEMYHTNAPGENCLKSVYMTKEGYQEYEAMGWLNGEHIRFEIPAGVTIHNLQYRETGYDTKKCGSFRCDDVLLNRLWEKCYRSLYVCMRDNFMDCPDRERAQWWGDANIEMQMLLYCMDEKAMALYENGVNCMVGWFEKTGNMLTVVPSGNMQFDLPFQNLAGIWGFMIYYQHTGKRAFVENAYPMSKAYVLQYEIGEDHLVRHRSGSWDWPDWGYHADITVMENAWYLLALQACEKMAVLLGCNQDVSIYRKRTETVRAGMKALVTSDGFYYHHTDNGIPDDRAHAVAVLAGLVSEEQKDTVADILMRVENASPYMEKYVLDALCEMGCIDDALIRIKKRYTPMVEDDYSTLWELWDKSCSLNHGWTGGPMVTMSKYIAGINVVEPGGKLINVKPHLGGLNWVHCTAPTPFGSLSVKVEKNQEGGTIVVTSPAEVTVQVSVPDDTCEEKEQNKWNIVLNHT